MVYSDYVRIASGASEPAVVRPADNDIDPSGGALELVIDSAEPGGRRVAALDELYSALDLVEIAAESGRDEATVARVYFALGGELDLHWLGRQISALPAETRWQNLARGALRSDLSTLARTLAGEAIRLAPAGGELDAVLDAWQSRAAVARERYQYLLAEIRGAQSIDLAMVSVLLRELRGMV